MGNPKKWGLHNTRTEWAKHGIRKTGAERAMDQALCNDPDAEEVSYQRRPKKSKDWELRSPYGFVIGFVRYPTKRAALDAADRAQKKGGLFGARWKGDITVTNRKTDEKIVVEYKKET